MADVRDLKDEAARAMGRGQWKAALKLYADLAKLEPKEGTWPLRAGDASRRLGEHKDAIGWYERAAATYGECGFTVRAIAVGKMIQSLDPGNDRVLRALDSAESRPAIKLTRPATAEAAAVSENSPSESVATAASAGPTASDVAASAQRPKAPPPLPPGVRPPVIKGPPLSGRLAGPLLSRPIREPSMQSVEIVFDDADDGIPIEEASILLLEDEAAMACGEGGGGSEVLDDLPAFPLFEILPCGAFLQLVSRMDQRHLDAGEVVVRQGEPGTSLFAIVDGEAVVYVEGRKEQPLAMLEAGDVFGEMALALDQPRAATVAALTPLELFEMDRELFRSILGEFPELGDVFSRLIKRRLVENVMATAPLFTPLEPAVRRELMLRFEVREGPAGTRIIEQGTASDGLYVVLAGQVVATLADAEGSRTVATLGPGQVLGAAGLIDPTHTSKNSFEASRDTIMLRLPRAAFGEVICCYPPVLEHLSVVADEQARWCDGGAISVV